MICPSYSSGTTVCPETEFFDPRRGHGLNLPRRKIERIVQPWRDFGALTMESVGESHT